MKRPPNLQHNDKAVILSPAGKIDKQLVFGAADVLEQWGLQVEVGENALCETGRFAGFSEQRLSDLQKAMNDPNVRLILCSRGGYGVVQLIDKLDFAGIKKNPKWIVGYSDITALHCALQTNGIMSLHAPMAKHFSDEGVEDVSVRHMKNILTGQPVTYHIPVGKNSCLNRIGTVSGKLFGGNLSVFCGLLGTQYVKVPKNGILFIEDIGELPYKVERMLYQLKFAGIFDQIIGLIIGQFTDYEEDNGISYTLYESIRKIVDEYDFPVCFDFPIGHVKENFPMIMGERVSLNISEDEIVLIQ
jgi:muramoyltetrapeptide carboxypeptidase